MSVIKINPKNKGKLHSQLGVSKGKKIPAKDLAIKPGDSPQVRKEKQFAINAKKWHKGK